MMRARRIAWTTVGLAAVFFGPTVITSAADEIDIGRGPVTVHVPASYDPSVAIPLVMLLHGYTRSGDFEEAYMRFLPLADEFGFFYLHPDGSRDEAGNQFWNATDSSSNFFGSEVDDSAYLRRLIEMVKARYNVDPTRVFVVGGSNGGFMSYRMACDHADTIAAIASRAGATYLDPAACSPTAPVHVLQIHGTSDTAIRFDGGSFRSLPPHPGAVETIEQWARYNGCPDAPQGWTPECGGRADPCDTSIPPLDLDSSLPGDETTVTRFADACEPGGSSELWRIVGGAHRPTLSQSFSRLVIEFLLAHPKTDCNGNGVPDEQDLTDGTSDDCNGNDFPDECEPDCNGNGVADSCDIAAGTSQDLDSNGVPTECEPELVQVMDGLGAQFEAGPPDTFISPLAETVPLNRFTLQATEDLTLVSATSTYTGAVGARRGLPNAPEVVGFTVQEGVGLHLVELDPAPLPGEWLKLSLLVRGASTGREAVMSLWLTHHPGDVNQDGMVNVRDATAFGDLFNNEGPLELLDLNGDGVIDARDATVFSDIWHGTDATQSWTGHRLPDKPR